MVSLSIPAGMPVDQVIKGVVNALVEAFPEDGGQAAFETLATYLPSTVNLAEAPAKVYAHRTSDVAKAPAAQSYPSQRARSRSRGRPAGPETLGTDSLALPVPGATLEVAGITDMRFQGTITAVHHERGFGFIDCPGLHARFNNKSIFIHPTNVGGFKAGDVVSFGVVLYKDGKPQAKDLRHAHVPSAPSIAAKEVSYEVELEPDIIGAFVGRQGASIMDLQKKAGGGVHIQVQPSLMLGGPQMCTVAGPQANAEYGRKLVLEKLAEIRRQRSIYDQVRAGQSAQPLAATAHGHVPTHDLDAALAHWDLDLLRGAASSVDRYVKEKAANPLNALSLGDPGINNDALHMIEVEADIIGAFVGKKGQCIMDLQGKTGGGIHIQIHPPTVQGGNQFAEVSGPKESADLGILLVRQKLDELRHTKTVHDTLRANGLIPAADGRPAVRSRSVPTAPGLELGEVFAERVTHGPGGQASYEVDVPAPLVGALVGKRGSVIMDLQSQSGACVHIQVHPPVVAGAAQVCEITGPSQNAEKGVRLVREKLVEIREQRAFNDTGRADQSRPPAPPNVYPQPGHPRPPSVRAPPRSIPGPPPAQVRPQSLQPAAAIKPLVSNTQNLQDTLRAIAALIPKR